MDDPYVRIQAHLRPGERLLWSGRPDPGVWFTPADTFLIPFSILWGSFVVFWEASVSNGPVFAVIWGMLFIAIGAYMVFGRFFYKRYRKKRTFYGITDQRAIVVVGRVFSDSPLRNQPVTVHRSSSGRHASVIFGARPGRGPFGGLYAVSAYFYANTGMEPFARNARNLTLPTAFYDVADPDAMLTAMDQARGPDPTT